MQLILVPAPLHLRLEPLLTSRIFADIGVIGVILLELHLILPGVLRQLMPLEGPVIHEWPEDALIVANLANNPKTLRMDLPNVPCQGILIAIGLVAGVSQFLWISWWRPPGAGIAHSLVDTSLVPLHGGLLGEALSTVGARNAMIVWIKARG